jgi:hypothetical protein
MSRYVPVGTVSPNGNSACRQRFADRGIGGAGLVAREDAANHVAVARAAIVRLVEVELLGAVGERRRSFTRVGERRQHEAIDAIGIRHRERRRAKSAGRFAEEMQPALPRLLDHEIGRRLQVLDAFGDIRVPFRPRRFPVPSKSIVQTSKPYSANVFISDARRGPAR